MDRRTDRWMDRRTRDKNWAKINIAVRRVFGIPCITIQQVFWWRRWWVGVEIEFYDGSVLRVVWDWPTGPRPNLHPISRCFVANRVASSAICNATTGPAVLFQLPLKQFLVTAMVTCCRLVEPNLSFSQQQHDKIPLLPPPTAEVMQSLLFACVFVCVSVSRITAKVIRRITAKVIRQFYRMITSLSFIVQ